MKTEFSLIILLLFIVSGCVTQTPSIVTPTLGVSPPTTSPQTSTPTKTSTVAEAAVPLTTELPVIEISPRGTLDPSAEFPIITEIHMTSETSGWAFALSGDNVLVTHTSDGGSSWQDVTPPIESWSAYISQHWYHVPRLGEGFFLDDRRAWISTLIVDQGDQSAFAAEVMLSTDDGGATWRMRKLPEGKGAGYGSFVGFTNPLHGWFVVYNYAGAGGSYTGLYRTVDGGGSWEAILDVLGTTSQVSGDLAFGDTTTGVMTFRRSFIVIQPYIRWTHDGGTTWGECQDLPEPEDPSASDPSISYFECGTASPHAFSKLEVALLVECRMLRDAGSIYNKYIYSNFLYSTEDGGLSWQSFPAPSGRLHLLSPSVGWMLGEEIHRTEDGGNSWAKINEVTWQGQFSFVDAHHGWAVARNDDEIALVRTENGGRSWMVVEPRLVP